MNSLPPFTPIETPRLLLPVLAPEHVPAVVAYRQLPEVMQYLSKRPVTVESVLEEVIYNQEAPTGTPGYRVRLVIMPKGADTVAGDIILKITEDDPDYGELGYALNPDYQGKGYATEAVRAVVGFAFDVLQLHRITATIFAEHTPSIRVVERIGMRREAHFRKAVLRDGVWIDDTVYALLREEWQSRQLLEGGE